MRLTWMLTVCISSAGLACAQDSHRLVDDLVKHWEASKALTLAVADAMPDEGYAFKATDPEMSFGEQINHIAGANANYCASGMGIKNPFQKPETNTKAVAVKTVTTAYDFCIDGLKKMTDADLMKMVGNAPRQSTVFERFWGGFTHAAHHRGQAEVYLRLKGITPPQYKF
jgi:uncharacterized damage-inducible protein DinB